jgi:hypothetical protein
VLPAVMVAASLIRAFVGGMSGCARYELRDGCWQRSRQTGYQASAAATALATTDVSVSGGQSGPS